MCVWRDKHVVKVEGVGRWNTQNGVVDLDDGGMGKKLFTHCSHSQAPTWKMHGASVRNTIICMAQRVEAMHATLLDTSIQDAPTVQYSLTQHGWVQQEDSEATRRLEKWTQTCFSKQRKRACVKCGPSDLCQCHNHHHHNPHSAAENCDREHVAIWWTWIVHNFRHSK